MRFTAPELSELLDLPLSTVSGILRRIGMGRLGRLGLEPAKRYERERPGELIHIDVKKLGRIAGGAGHPERYGITVERLITDNGAPYRSTLHAIACRTLGIRHLRTRPYRPQPPA